MTPPPLPQNQPTNKADSSSPPPILPQTNPQPDLRSSPGRSHRSTIKWIRNIVIAAVVVAIIAVGALAATCPNEVQLRNALYGELGPTYKAVLEWADPLAKMAHLPHIEYHNHVIYSTLDWYHGGSETRLASGAAGRVQLDSNVDNVKRLILSVPKLRDKLEEKR